MDDRVIHILNPIVHPDLSRLTEWDMKDFSSNAEVANHIMVRANAPLYDLRDKNKQIRISDHFKAGEFAVSGNQSYDYARIHKDLVYELEKIRVFFNRRVKIVNGYMSLEYWHNLTDGLEIENQHGAGLAARIKIMGVPPLKMAKFAIIIGKKDTSISVGLKDIIIAVNQQEPKILSHIGNNTPQMRRARENAIKELVPYRDFLHGQYSDKLAPLNEHYKWMRSLLIIPKSSKKWQEIVDEKYEDFLREQKEIIIQLFRVIGGASKNQRDRRELSKNKIVTFLFYSDYYNLFRAYYRLFDQFRNDPTKKDYLAHGLAIKKIGELLCPGLIQARLLQQPHTPSSCIKNPMRIKLPQTKFNKNYRRDQLIRNDLMGIVAKATKEVRQGKARQRGVVLGANKSENRIDKPKPDNPTYDITGRYEVIHKRNRNLIGETFVINQAGTHIYGVHSYVHRPSAPLDVSKAIFPFRGDEVGDVIEGYYIEEAHWSINIVGIFRHTLKVSIINNANKVAKQELELKKVSSRPSHLQLESSEVSDLVKHHEQSPLLTIQQKNILENFSGKKLKVMDEILERYSVSSSDKEQLKIANEIDEYFKRAFTDRNNGIHLKDSVLSGYYLSVLLTKEKWAPDGLDTLTRYDYLNRLVGVQQVKMYYPGGVYWTRKYLNLQNLDKDADPRKFIYKVKISLKGASITSGFGASAFKGELTIEKTKGDGIWEVGGKDKAVYSIYLIGVSGGLGLNFSIEGEAEFATSIEWLPEDFFGLGGLVRGSSSISAAGGGGGFENFFIICNRPVGTFKADFYSRNITFHDMGFNVDNTNEPKFDTSPNTIIGKSVNPNIDHDTGLPTLKRKRVKPTVKSGTKVRIEGELSGNAIYIRSPKVKPDLKPSVVKRDYNLKYESHQKYFFGFDSAILTPNARQLLRWMCAREFSVLTQPHVDIKIHGFTDKAGTEQYNYKLGLNRAINVRIAIRDILGEKLWIKDGDIEVKSNGESLQENNKDYDPKFRGAKVIVNGIVVLTLDAPSEN